MTDSKLTPKLALLLEWATRNPTQKRATFEPLPGGLLIKVYVDHTGLRHLLLARRGDVGPSDQECQTVIAHWPEKLAAPVEWSKFDRLPYHCRAAMFRPKPPIQTSRQMELGATQSDSRE